MEYTIWFKKQEQEQESLSPPFVQPLLSPEFFISNQNPMLKLWAGSAYSLVIHLKRKSKNHFSLCVVSTAGALGVAAAEIYISNQIRPVRKELSVFLPVLCSRPNQTRPHPNCIQTASRSHPDRIQTAFMSHQGYIQAISRPHSDRNQTTFTLHWGNIQATFRPH